MTCSLTVAALLDLCYAPDLKYRLDDPAVGRQRKCSVDDLAIQPAKKEHGLGLTSESVEVTIVGYGNKNDFAQSQANTASSRPETTHELSGRHLRETLESDKSANEPPEAEEDNTAKPCLPPLVTKLSPSPMFQNEFFAVSRSEIAGWGAFAAKDLKLGDTILREIPLFVAAESSEIFHEFDKLDAQAKNVALSLHANELLKPGTSRLKAVWDTNCFAIGSKRAGLFPIAARFNHACHPAHNIEYRFDRDLGCLKMTVRVDKITAGEELKISYGTNRTPELLYFWYGFQCRCGACEGLSDEDVSRLTDQW